jgi:hypothetical protein
MYAYVGQKKKRHVLPCVARDVGLVVPGIDCPEGDWQANPVESCTSNLSNVLLSLQIND